MEMDTQNRHACVAIPGETAWQRFLNLFNHNKSQMGIEDMAGKCVACPKVCSARALHFHLFFVLRGILYSLPVLILRAIKGTWADLSVFSPAFLIAVIAVLLVDHFLKSILLLLIPWEIIDVPGKVSSDQVLFQVREDNHEKMSARTFSRLALH